MSEVTGTKGRRMNGKLRSTVLVILVPVLLMALLGAATGSLALGGAEMAILLVIWAVGLFLVWRPRRRA